MTEFTKLKIGFALALLGTLFALHPFLDQFADLGFLYLGHHLKIAYAYALAAGLLSLCVYLYAVTLLSERPYSWCEHAGNYAYALAILVLPIYIGLFLSARLAERVAVSHLAWAAPALTIGLGFSWVALTQWLAWRVQGHLGVRDLDARLDQLADQEVEALNQSRELFESQHFDLSVIEAYRALEARLRQVLLRQGSRTRMETPQAVIRVATRKGILREPTLGVLRELARSWTIAVSAQPLPREDAIASLSAVRHVLSVIPVDEPSTSREGHRRTAHGQPLIPA